MSNRQAFRSQAKQIAATDPIYDPCYCTRHVILKVSEEGAMNDALHVFAPLSNYRERLTGKLTGISNKTLSRTKADSENAVLAPRKPWRDRVELSDFEKCEVCINCKTHTQQTRQQTIYNTKKIFDFRGSNHSLSSLLFKKTNVYVRLTD